MHIVHVHVKVKPDAVQAFTTATLANAQESINEPGVARFDVIQLADDPTQFVLVEVYRTPADQVKHREAQHYKTWRDVVADMMAEPRAPFKYINVFPGDEGWVDDAI